MAVFKCKICGANLELKGTESVCICDFCETYQTLPRFDDDRKIALFTRANNLRIKSEFDKAEGIYESIVTEFRDEAEAYWGLVLCKYGVEYVDDGKGRRVPTCHRTLPVSIMEDDDFQQACEYASLEAKNIYREEAKVVDSIQRKILNIALNEDPYDIFICYKETDDLTANRTEDSIIAQDIYTRLIKSGYKVFFARDSLKSIAGAEYEPYIYAALSSSKLMLAIGTKYEYYDSVWVKNEWSRFISMMNDNTSKVLIPCYRNMDAYDMPKEFKNMQALDMGDVTFFGSLTDNINRILKKSNSDKSAGIVSDNKANDVSPLLERGFMFVEDENWGKADEFFEAVLNKDPRNVNAYLGKLLGDLHVTGVDKLSELALPFFGNANYEKIMRFADDELKSKLENYNHIIELRNEENRQKDIYENALEMMANATTEEMFENTGYLFLEVKDYKDAKAKADECFERGEVARVYAENTAKDKSYNYACSVIAASYKWRGKEGDINALRDASITLQHLGEWRDSSDKYKECVQRIDQLERQYQDIRNYEIQQAERIKEINNLKRKKRKKLFVVISAVVCLLIVLTILLSTVIIPVVKRNVFVSKYGEKAYSSFGLVEVGSYVKFGEYEQNNADTDGKEEIEWLVLDIKNDKALLISKYVLDCKKFNDDYDNTNVTWETSTIRQWLNNDFYDSAFSEEEKKRIPTVTVSADENPDYMNENVFQGDDTNDKIFLLSVKEAYNYFSSDEKRNCEPTKFAKNNGIVYNNCWYWLRTVGKTQDSAAEVEDGYVFSHGRNVNESHSVRPVMWINLK